MKHVAILLLLAGCGEISWNTRVADAPPVRSAMLQSVELGKTTEDRLMARWGAPTQRIREGAQTSFVYRDMRNPPGYAAPQFGNSNDYVVVVFQYGLAVGAYSNDTEGCRATFPPRPPGPGFSNPTTVYPANCGDLSQYLGSDAATGDGSPMGDGNMPPDSRLPGVPDDSYIAGRSSK